MDSMQYPSGLHISSHPLVAADVTLLRDKRTQVNEFRSALRRIGRFLAFEAGATMETREVEVHTPLETVTGAELKRRVVLVPILRAGLGMLDGVLDVFPDAAVGHIGLYRDETTLESISYYQKLPRNLSDADVFLIDPMLATGGSALEALRLLRQAGATHVRMLVLVAAPSGIASVTDNAPGVEIYAAALDRELNDKGYILPGLGDAGDRLFGTQ